MEGLNRILHYQILKPVGSGGMSTVYMALDDKLKRTVAIKMLHPHLCKEPLAVERFRREALSAAKLDHPNIVRIYDYLIENNVHGIVMEYVPGLDIETIVKRKGPLEFKTALYLMHKVAVALKAAHQQGLMHRDVKPSNILLHEDGRVMLSDFGLVKHSLDVSLTVDNAVAGTPAFMSPEQMSGRKAGFSSDVYAWAVTFYYLLSGTLPYPAKEFADIVRAIQSANVHLDKTVTAAMPLKCFALLSQCLLENPADRPQTGGDLLKGLSAAPPPEEMDLVKLFALPRTVSPGVFTEQMSRTRVFYGTWQGKNRLRFAALFLGFVLAGVIAYKIIDPRKPASDEAASFKARPIETAVSPSPVATAPKESQAVVVLPRKPSGKINPVPGVSALAPPADTIPAAVEAPVVADSGGLFITCEPWANVMIDGRDFGQTPIQAPIPLAVGVHHLRLTNPYSENLSDSVTIAKGVVLRKRYVLQVRPAYSQPPAVKP